MSAAPDRWGRALTAIDEEDASASLDLALAVAPYFDLTQAEARKVASETGRAVANWRQTAATLGIARRKNKGLLLLKDIRKDLMGPRRLPLPAILAAFETLPVLSPIGERVAACILGVRQ